MSRNAAGGDQAAIVSGDNDRGAAVARQQQQLLCEWHVTPVGNAYALNTLLMIWTLSFEMVRCVRIKAVVWNPCMTDIYLHLICAHYGLYGNAQPYSGLVHA